MPNSMREWMIGAEGLAEHRRQPPSTRCGDAALFSEPRCMTCSISRQGSVERHQRIHTQQQVQAFVKAPPSRASIFFRGPSTK